MHGQDVEKGVKEKYFLDHRDTHKLYIIYLWFTTPKETSHVSATMGKRIVGVNCGADSSLKKRGLSISVLLC